MDNQTQQDDLFDVEVDSISKKHISEMAVWAKIVAISAFISYGLSLVIAIFGNRSAGEGFVASTTKASSLAGVLITLIIGVIINIYLFKFSNEVKNGIDGTDQGSLENGFNSLRIYFKIIGILIIIFISLMVIALLLARGVTGL
jgi:hypothetical protein